MRMWKSLVFVLLLVPLTAWSQQDPSVTMNQDIKSMATSMDQMMVEINNAASTRTTGVSSADTLRWTSYIEALTAYAAWVVGEPNPLDMPKTSSLTLPVENMPELGATQNRTADDLVRLLGSERMELVLSQSSAMVSGLLPADYHRFLAVMSKMSDRILLATSTSALDVPWTLPQISGQPSAESQGMSLP